MPSKYFLFQGGSASGGKISFLFITAVILTLGLSISFQSLLAAYTAPLANPATCDTGNPGCDAPISSSSALIQQIQGSMWIINSAYPTSPNGLIVEKGKVGIGMIAPNEKLEVAGNIKSSGVFMGQGGANITHLPWFNIGASFTGYLKLVTPIVHNESNMFVIKITGYEYGQGGKVSDIKCGGYAYSGSTLTNTYCYTDGTNLPVEIGAEDRGGTTYVVVRLGTPTWSAWYYSHFTAEYVGWNAKDPAAFTWVKAETTPAQTGNTNNVIIDDRGGSITVAGQNVCLANGTNCPVPSTNATTLSGVDISRIVYGSNQYKTSGLGSSISPQSGSGFYESSNAADGPIGASWTHYLVTNHSNSVLGNGYQMIIAQPYWEDNLYTRRVDSDNKRAWRKILDSGNYSAYALPVSGGAITGNLNVSGTLTAATISGGYSGTISAANVSSGAFGSNTGGGNFSFPGSSRLAINGSSFTSGSAFGFGNGAAWPNVSSLAVDTLETDGGVGGSGTLELNYYGGNEVHIGSGGSKPLRASIFYDGNTGYYADPNGTSRMGTINADLLRSYSNVYTDGNYGNGLVGVYSSTRYQGVYAMGDAYKLAADGLSPGTLYGIAWTHSNVGGQSKAGLSHQALFMANGVTQTAIGTGIWTNGNLTVNGNATISGTITAATISGGYSGTINAANVSSGAFGSNTGGGNYSFPGTLTGNEVFTNGWLRNNASLTGLYNQTNGNHIYSESPSYWTMTSAGNSTGGLIFRDQHQSILRGYVYHDTSGFGLLHSAGGWAVRVNNGSTELFGTSYANGGTICASNNNCGYTSTGSSNTWTGIQYFQSNLGPTSGLLNSPPLEVYSTGNNSAFMSFHKGGYYAVNMGLDSDNVLRIGGWSAGANRWQLDMSGNETLAGNISAVNGNFSGTITAATISGGYSGTINAANVSAGAFGSNTGGGNYSFPGILTSGGLMNATNYFQINGKYAIDGTDSYLRLNQQGSFGSGIYTPYVLRADGIIYSASSFRVGAGSSNAAIMDSDQFYCNNGSNCRFNYSGSGQTYVGNAAGTTIAANVNIGGTLTVGGKLNVSGADVAEEFGTMEELDTGTVVVMRDDGVKTAKPCEVKYDKKVIGVVSDNPSIIMGKIPDKIKAVIALTGVVKVKVTTQNGYIEKGDLLVTSDLRGHAMKATEEKVGTIIGKALENFSGQTGQITALINLQ